MLCAAFLRVHRFARGIGVCIGGLLHGAGLVEILGQRVEDRLRGGWRRIGILFGGAAENEQTGQRDTRKLQHAHIPLVTACQRRP